MSNTAVTGAPVSNTTSYAAPNGSPGSVKSISSSDATAGSTSAPIDVQAAAFNPDGLALTTTVGAPTGGSASVASDGRVLASMPAGTASQVHRVPYTLTSGLMSSSSIITVRVQPPVVVPVTGLPAGYPTPPDFSGAETVNVSTSMMTAWASGPGVMLPAGRFTSPSVPMEV